MKGENGQKIRMAEVRKGRKSTKDNARENYLKYGYALLLLDCFWYPAYLVWIRMLKIIELQHHYGVTYQLYSVPLFVKHLFQKLVK